MGAKSGPLDRPASASVMPVALPPKSSSATTPARGSPGLVFSAPSAATASDTSVGGTPLGDRFGLVRNIARRAPSTAGPQWEGTAITTREGGGILTVRA